MAKRVITELIDDLTGEKADETVSFGLDGHQFMIDLSRDNAGELRDNLARYLAKSRKVSKGVAAPAIRRRTTNGQSPSADAGPTAAIREWAIQRGVTVADRGRLSREVLEAYAAAHNQLDAAG